MNGGRNGENEPANVFSACDVDELSDEKRPIDSDAALNGEGANEPGRRQVKRGSEEFDEFTVEVVQGRDEPRRRVFTTRRLFDY